jgi:hypothetical protein
LDALVGEPAAEILILEALAALNQV